ncbi:hypothetical protein [Haloactinomyces albus]|uniref:Uncharacterized protein n=1 Tax=Haloactinomyces albus TaxID=1352928 RepID=A0AAE4CMZ7_9ACTN|nr:hypothetical protein [Haloactinomyces albus]MDR7300133.1 hypothetical protein [Haloactinomyces albus]
MVIPGILEQALVPTPPEFASMLARLPSVLGRQFPIPASGYTR